MHRGTCPPFIQALAQAALARPTPSLSCTVRLKYRAAEGHERALSRRGRRQASPWRSRAVSSRAVCSQSRVCGARIDSGSLGLELLLAPLAVLALAPDSTVGADGGAPAVLALAPLAVMRTDGGAPAVLAPAPAAVMRADGGAPAVLALAPLAVMQADGGAPAVLALPSLAVMLADGGAPAVLAVPPHAPVRADAAPPAALALALQAAMRALLPWFRRPAFFALAGASPPATPFAPASASPAPRHSRHLPCCLPCSHTPLPPAPLPASLALSPPRPVDDPALLRPRRPARSTAARGPARAVRAPVKRTTAGCAHCGHAAAHASWKGRQGHWAQRRAGVLGRTGSAHTGQAPAPAPAAGAAPVSGESPRWERPVGGGGWAARLAGSVGLGIALVETV